MALGDGGLWQMISLWRWSPREWDWHAYERNARELSHPSCHEGTQREDCSWPRKPGFLDRHANIVTLDFPASRTVEKKRLLLKSHPAYGFFVRAAWRDGDTVPGVCYVFMCGCAGSSLLCVGFLWVQRVGSTLGCVQASPCSGFSGCGVQSLGTVDSVVVTHRLNSTNLQDLEHGLRGCGAWT